MKHLASRRLLPLLFLLVHGVHASITLQSTISIETTEEGVSFTGHILNQGTKTAEDCTIEILSPVDAREHCVSVGHLDPGITNTWTHAYPHPETAQRGTFCAIVRTHYADPNAFRLHAMQLFTYVLGNAAEAPLRLAFEPPKRPIPGTELEGMKPLTEIAPLEGSLSCTLRLLPQSDVPALPGTLRLVLPDSMQAAWEDSPCVGGLLWSNDLTRALAPPYPSELRFVITNLTALAGSRLSIGALFTATDASHTTRTATTTLQIPVETTPPNLLPDNAAVLDRSPLPPSLPWIGLFVLLLAEALFRLRPKAPTTPALLPRLFELFVLLYAYALLAYELRLDLVFAPGLCLGGDTPAHHYLLSHLQESLRHGRIVSWAPGWWCGFPMYQFYFPLPYLAMAVLDLLLPTPIAFKLGTILGLLLTPLCTYAAARLLRLPRPAPALLVLAILPLLFDTTHVMWGVNAASTLAGMISNSWSFALFPLAAAATLRDLLDARPRLRTIALLTASLLSHFFTSIVLALLLISLLPFLLPHLPRALRLRALRAFLIDGALTCCLIAPWLLPLIETRPWSVDFGDPWTIHFWANLPSFAKLSLLPILATALVALHKRFRPAPTPLCLALLIATLQLSISLFLFFCGYSISKVFVNCRLWPFIVHALLALGALATAALLRQSRLPICATLVFALFVATFPWDPPNYCRNYARWNFAGLEDRPDAPVYYDLVARLHNTPGRFSADLHPDNVRFGSTRAFEALPALANKAILEGGIVNSALGSLAAYSIQGEVSDAPAGWPLRVIPRSRNLPLGLRHLELLGVRHFLARSSHVQRAIEADPHWSLLHNYGRWRLYENPEVDGSLVHAYPAGLPSLITNDVQGAIIAWCNTPELASTPQIILSPNETPPPPTDTPAAAAAATSPIAIPCTPSFNRISFTTPSLGIPHLIATSAFPNWKVLHGATHLYTTTPGFMVVYPTEHTVTLAFSPTRADWIGRAFLLLGLLALYPLTHLKTR